MASFGDLKAQVASDLCRSNLPTEIHRAVLDAIQDHDTERFYFNCSEVYDFVTQTGVDEYTIMNQDPIHEFIKIDSVRARVGGTWYTLRRDYPRDMDEDFSTITTGQPSRWSVSGTDLRIFPTPDRD